MLSGSSPPFSSLPTFAYTLILLYGVESIFFSIKVLCPSLWAKLKYDVGLPPSSLITNPPAGPRPVPDSTMDTPVVE